METGISRLPLSANQRSLRVTIRRMWGVFREHRRLWLVLPAALGWIDVAPHLIGGAVGVGASRLPLYHDLSAERESLSPRAGRRSMAYAYQVTALRERSPPWPGAFSMAGGTEECSSI